MKIKIWKTSEGAYLNPKMEYREIQTLEDLLAIHAEYNESLIVGRDKITGDMTVEIYDDWRE